MDLAHEARRAVRPRELAAEELDRHGPVVLRVRGEIDGGRASVAEQSFAGRSTLLVPV
jgi:hypothetical protein